MDIRSFFIHSNLKEILCFFNLYYSHCEIFNLSIYSLINNPTFQSEEQKTLDNIVVIATKMEVYNRCIRGREQGKKERPTWGSNPRH